MQKLSVTPPKYSDNGRQMSTMVIQRQTVDRGVAQHGRCRVEARRVVIDLLTTSRVDLIEALAEAAHDGASVAPPPLVHLVRPRFASGMPATDVARAIADEYSVPARLYGTLLRLVNQFAPIAVVHIEPAGARLDDVDDDEQETGWDGDGFQEFLGRASHDLLTFDEEQALGRAISEGRLAQRLLDQHRHLHVDDLRGFRRTVEHGKQAENELVRCNMRLVMSIAFRQQRRCTASFSVEDLVDEGYFGLAKAVEKWDYTRGLKFSTYATWWIRQTTSRAIENQSHMIRIPVHMQERIRAAWRAGQELQAHGAEVSDDAVAEKLGLSAAQVADLRSYQRKCLALDAPGRGDTAPLLLRLPDPRAEAAHEALFREVDDDQLIGDLLAGLTIRQQQVIKRRFGLDDGQRRTLEEVGEEFGVTRERIRQIEAKVIKRLRHRASKGDFGAELQDKVLRMFGSEEVEE